MYRLMSAQEAVSFIKDGDNIVVNSFLALSHPEALEDALFERFSKSGSPSGLTVMSTAGFGSWREDRNFEPLVASGAVKRVVSSHYSTMPITTKKALDNEIEAYCLPLGVISHLIRSQAGGKNGLFSKVGLGLFVDPRQEGPGINERSKEKFVSLMEIDKEEYLFYRMPRPNVALIKGTTVDVAGNISFENEYITGDALSIAQAVKAAGGKVLVQVDRVSHYFSRPRNVIVPGMLVDAVVVAEPTENHKASQALSGDIHVPPAHMPYWMDKLASSSKKRDSKDNSANIIGERAARELKEGDIVNIGIGYPENVGKYALESGKISQITLTVEAGGIGGVPASGTAFGATIGADMVSDISMQFDFYDGSGLDICFMGALEVDKHGNVNAHKMTGRYAGIGGFANITGATKTVVFCFTMTTKGLVAKLENGNVSIENEGSIIKIKEHINSISFSAKQALKNGQRVLYVTERCVFELTENGLKLKEVYPGVDEKTQIRDILDFELA